jgi:hypothetical protein
MSFDPQEHPRATDGTFSQKVGTESEVALAPTPSVIVAEGGSDSIAFTAPDGEELVMYHDEKQFAEHIDPMVREREDGNFDVYFASYDEDPPEYQFMEGDELEGFSSAWERDEYIEKKLSEGVSPQNIFVVERFEHSSVRYTPLANWEEWSNDPRPESQRLNDQWDSAPSHVYIAGESDNPAEQAKGIMDDYTDYANGDNYVLHHNVVDRDGEVLERESVHGFIGSDAAEESVRAGEV